MKAARIILIILLVFASGCSNGGVSIEPFEPTIKPTESVNTPRPVETCEPSAKPTEPVNTPQPSEIPDISPSSPFDWSNFPPPEWLENSVITYSDYNEEIGYVEGIHHDRFWTQEGLAFLEYYGLGGTPTEDKPLVPDKETAIAIASTIFYAQELIDDWIIRDYFVPSGVFFDTQDEVWIVNFSYYTDGYAPGTVTIVLRKDNAQVLAIWAEAG